MFLRILSLAVALSVSSFAQTHSAGTSPVSRRPQSSEFQVNVARNDREVIITWILPQVDIKQFEIFRHTSSSANGRGRVASVRTQPPVYYDNVPESETKYWYWLKVTLADGFIMNIGPVATPESKVWIP